MDSVKFVGSQPSQKIPDYLSASNVVWVSMSGFVVYEAAAAEKPIVAFDVEWHREFIETNKTGILVRNRNRRELAQAVTYLLENPSNAKELGRNAKLKMRRQYDPARLIDLETRIYEQIIRRTELAVGTRKQHVID
jgi:glycosyltransferase involved in cell wall biosynthesis